MAIIRARAPLRLGLAGGGTDVSPYCDLYGGYVLNAAIDRYAYTVIEELLEPQIVFISADKKEQETISIDHFSPTRNAVEKLALHHAVYRYMVVTHLDGRPQPIKMTTFCDSPVGSGLGSSSTLVVSMIRAFVEYLDLKLDEYAIAHLAFKIEREDCGLQGGRQDQYSATFGGFNFMEFYADNRVVVNPLRIKKSTIYELEASLILYYSGISRQSAAVIADQSNNVREQKTATVEAMHGLKQEAVAMKECLLKGSFAGIVESMKMGWENKKRSSSSVSNEVIEQAYKVAIDAGALAGKVSGAGGGGFMLFYTPTEMRMNVIRALMELGGDVSNCHFTQEGCQAWIV
jgi:D-glycero-alpha-D-manno-heptose-7-phosphate kinase